MLIQSANLALRFLLELCVLAAIAYWGFHAKTGVLVKIGLGIGIPLVIAIIWGIYGAPQSSQQLHGIARAGLELVVFGAGVLALYLSGRHTLAGVFACLIVMNWILLYVWKQ